MEFKSLLNIILRRWRLAAIIFGAIFVTVVGGSLLVTSWYESSAKVVITRPRAAAALLSNFGLSTYNQESSVSDEERDTVVGLAQVGPVLDEVSTRLKLEKERIRYRLLFAVPGLRATLEWMGIQIKSKRPMTAKDLVDSSSLRYLLPVPHIEVSQYSSSNIIEIAATHTDRLLAQSMANLAAELFMENEFKRARKDYADLVDYVDKNLERSRKQLSKDLETRRRYQLKEKSINLDTEISTLINRVSDAKKSLEELKANIFRVRSAIAAMERQLKDNPEFRRAGEDITRSSETLSALKNKLADQYVLLMEAQSKYAKGHPELERYQSQVAEIKRLIKEEMGKLINLDSTYGTVRSTLISSYAELAGLEAQQKGWPLVLAGYEKEILAQPERIAQQAQLDLNVKASQNVYQLYQEYSQKLKMAGEVDLRTLHLVDPARAMPEDEAKPKMTTVLAITIVLGAFFGLGAIFFLEFVDTSVHSSEDLARLGVEPYLGLVKGALDLAPTLVALNQPNSPVAEALRGVRHALRLAGGEDGPAHMVITSPAGPEGRHFLAANLALGLAQEGKRVLLMDGDLRGPCLHEIFAQDNGRGWGGLEGGALSLEQLARPTQVAGLSLITAGPTPANIGRAVESPGLAALLEQAREQYDRVLVVGPPLLTCSDSLVWGERLQGVLLAVAACRTGQQETAQALGLIRAARLDLLGAALTF